jgi:hypothetical protein
MHTLDQSANNSTLEADQGRLKATLRPMRGLKRFRSARVVAKGHTLSRTYAAVITRAPSISRQSLPFAQPSMSCYSPSDRAILQPNPACGLQPPNALGSERIRRRGCRGSPLSSFLSGQREARSGSRKAYGSASAPIGSQAGSTRGSWSRADLRSSGSRFLWTTTSNTYSSNHESLIV